jgi:hypothetical protein
MTMPKLGSRPHPVILNEVKNLAFGHWCLCGGLVVVSIDQLGSQAEGGWSADEAYSSASVQMKPPMTATPPIIIANPGIRSGMTISAGMLTATTTAPATLRRRPFDFSNDPSGINSA